MIHLHLVSYHLNFCTLTYLVQIIYHWSIGMPFVIWGSSCKILVFIAQATEMTKFMTVSALIFSSKALESLYVLGISTFMTSIFTLKMWLGLNFSCFYIHFSCKVPDGDLNLNTPCFLDLNLFFLNCFLCALFGGNPALWCLNKIT